jgi:hypothetical protein
MSGFKNTTKTVSGHHHWGGGSIGGGTGGTINRLSRGGAVDKIDSSPGHAEVFPKEGNRMDGNALTLRKESPTQELEEHGGKSPLISKFKKGGPAKHFHVHKHFHAKGGRTHSVSHSYGVMEKHAEKFADGGHVHDCTEVPAGGPDYAKGGKTKPVHKNAGGAMYAPGGPVVGMAPQMGAMARPALPPGAGGASGPLQRRPTGLPVRAGPPMRRPMVMPGPQPLMRAEGGTVPMRKVARQEVAKHVRRPPPRGHGVR